MADGNRLYPVIEPEEVESSEPAATTSPRVSDHCCNDAGQSSKISQVGLLRPEKSIPDAILKQGKGLAILTVAKVGLMVGTGLVIAPREDGFWSTAKT